MNSDAQTIRFHEPLSREERRGSTRIFRQTLEEARAPRRVTFVMPQSLSSSLLGAAHDAKRGADGMKNFDTPAKSPLKALFGVLSGHFSNVNAKSHAADGEAINQVAVTLQTKGAHVKPLLDGLNGLMRTRVVTQVITQPEPAKG